MNLTWEVREGLVKHHTSYDHPGRRKGFAAQILLARSAGRQLADEITYYSHDLDDGLDSGLLSEKQLNRDVRIWRQAARTVEKEYGELPDECRRYFIIRCIIDMQVRDVVETTERQILKAGVRPARTTCGGNRDALVQYSPARRELNLELRRYLYKNLYYNPGGARAQPARRADAGGFVPAFSEASRTRSASRPANAPAKSAGIAPSAIISPA